MHRQLGSRFLIGTLNELSLCSSCSEIQKVSEYDKDIPQKYERCAVVYLGTGILGLGSTAFIQS